MDDIFWLAVDGAIIWYFTKYVRDYFSLGWIGTLTAGALNTGVFFLVSRPLIRVAMWGEAEDLRIMALGTATVFAALILLSAPLFVLDWYMKMRTLRNVAGVATIREARELMKRAVDDPELASELMTKLKP